MPLSTVPPPTGDAARRWSGPPGLPFCAARGDSRATTRRVSPPRSPARASTRSPGGGEVWRAVHKLGEAQTVLGDGVGFAKAYRLCVDHHKAA